MDVRLKKGNKEDFVFGTWATVGRVPFPEMMISMEEETILLLSKSSSGSLLASPVGVLVMYVLCKMENCNFHMNENRILSFEQNHMKCFWIDFIGASSKRTHHRCYASIQIHQPPPPPANWEPLE